jgi:hypothetical protein
MVAGQQRARCSNPPAPSAHLPTSPPSHLPPHTTPPARSIVLTALAPHRLTALPSPIPYFYEEAGGAAGGPGGLDSEGADDDSTGGMSESRPWEELRCVLAVCRWGAAGLGWARAGPQKGLQQRLPGMVSGWLSLSTLQAL